MDRLIPPAAGFLRRDGLIELTEILGAAQNAVRYVGGIVRDTLLGIDAADIDLATRHAPEDVLVLLGRAGIKGIPTGIAHGTVTAILPSGPVEVTTLRRDVSTDGRHAVVAFTDDWRADAARRDFTMNALYANPQTLAVIDYFGGLEDLAAARVRFIGDPLQRIAEDHLRILRYFRFHARFGDAPDAAALDACTARANDLMALSRERIAAELLKLLVARHAVEVAGIMLERGIFAPVLPEIDRHGVARLSRLAEREAQVGLPPDPLRRLAALLPPRSVEDVGARLKLSNADRKRLASAVIPAGDEAASVIAYRLGETLAIDRLLLTERAPPDIAAIIGRTPPVLPIGGGALVARGVDKGPEVAALLRGIEEQWIAEGFPGAPRVAAIADAQVARLLSTR